MNKNDALFKQMAIIVSLLSLYFIWGSTYLAIKYAVLEMDPFLMLGVRFIIASLIIFAYLKYKKIPFPTAKEFLNSSAVGTLLLVGGLGGVAYSEQWLPSSIVAVIIATIPMLMVVAGFIAGKKINFATFIGVLLGLSGVVLIYFYNSENASISYPSIAIISIAFAPLFWTLGTLLSEKIKGSSNVFMDSAVQMFSAGLVFILVFLIVGDYSVIQIERISTTSILAVIYLIVFGSLIAYTAYVYLLSIDISKTLVTSYAYVNPLVAILLGVFIGGELIYSSQIMGSSLIVVGVFLISIKSDFAH